MKLYIYLFDLKMFPIRNYADSRENILFDRKNDDIAPKPGPINAIMSII